LLPEGSGLVGGYLSAPNQLGLITL
jgi:hypothetical protein